MKISRNLFKKFCTKMSQIGICQTLEWVLEFLQTWNKNERSPTLQLNQGLFSNFSFKFQGANNSFLWSPRKVAVPPFCLKYFKIFFEFFKGSFQNKTKRRRNSKILAGNGILNYKTNLKHSKIAKFNKFFNCF